MGLKENLPKFVAEEKYTKEILEAIQPEIDAIKLRLISALLECCVTTCSEVGIEKFEKDYSIPYDATLTLDERKRAVINKMLNKNVLTFDELAEFVKRNIEEKQFYISNMAEEYEFTIMLVDEKYKEKLFSALYEIRPAHLRFNIKIVKYERRCNTFSSGTEPI